MHVLSVDEKTCIQAIECHEAIAPKSKGGHHRREFEYKCHGTTTFIAAINVANGKLIHTRLQSTRDEKDFADFIKQTVAMLPEMDKFVILSDQLNTHLSETLVRFVAEDGGYVPEDLGVKGQNGILKKYENSKGFFRISISSGKIYLYTKTLFLA